MAINVTTKRRRILFKQARDLEFSEVKVWLAIFMVTYPRWLSSGYRVKVYDVQHALSCKKGDFITLRHNHIRIVTPLNYSFKLPRM